MPGIETEDISGLAGQVSLHSVRNTIQQLAGFSTRFTFSDKIVPAREWIFRQFLNMGYTDVYYQDFVICDSVQKNVICSKTGGSKSAIILCAHYDSTARDTVGWDWQRCPAPGANDNASGVAAMLEIARILRNVNIGMDVRFIAFAGEEQNLSGSRAYADAINNALDISLVINLDEIGYPDAEWNIVIGEDQGNHNPEKNAASHEFALVMARCSSNYTRLKNKFLDIWASDHLPFNNRGYAVLGVCGSGMYRHTHEVTDTCDKIDMDYVVEVTRMALATIMHVAVKKQFGEACKPEIQRRARKKQQVKQL